MFLSSGKYFFFKDQHLKHFIFYFLNFYFLSSSPDRVVNMEGHIVGLALSPDSRLGLNKIRIFIIHQILILKFSKHHIQNKEEITKL